jgi:nitrogen regulatory protein PII
VKKVVAIVSPAKLDQIREMLARVGVDGMTVSSVLGLDREHGHTEKYRAVEHVVSFLPRVKVEIVVEDGRVPPLIHELVRVTRTGRIGDGKIFVTPVSDAIRIRTDERGSDAI